jgi:GNAT superfamily N-acetyltransferase
MIRHANRYDKNAIFDMVNALNQECAISQFATLYPNQHGDELWNNLWAGQGLMYVAEEKNKLVGVIIGMITQSVWSKSIRGLYEIAWYVEPKYRHTPIAHRLMTAYIKEAKRYKETGIVQFLTISKMVNKFDRQFAKLGFTKTDENWIL